MVTQTQSRAQNGITTQTLTELATFQVGVTEPSVIGKFEARLGGALITPADAAYEAARRLPDGTKTSPLLVVQCANARDVATAVYFAGAHELPIGVRADNRGIAEGAFDGAIVLDVTGVRDFSIDPLARF